MISCPMWCYQTKRKFKVGGNKNALAFIVQTENVEAYKQNGSAILIITEDQDPSSINNIDELSRSNINFSLIESGYLVI